MNLRSPIDFYLDGMPGPAVRPVDGDCLVWAPRVTEVLQQSGLATAQLVTVWGYLGEATEYKLLAFAHQATRWEHVIIDFTARFFDDDLPARWVIAEDEYTQKLAAATGVAKVEVTPLAAGSAEER